MTTPPDPVAGIVGRLGSLADMCEAAISPMRWLDGDIALHAFGNVTRAGGEMFYEVEGEDVKTVPHFTASIDAAITLAPAGVMVVLACGLSSLADAQVNRLPGLGKSPALALCAAALRARAALAPTSPPARQGEGV